MKGVEQTWLTGGLFTTVYANLFVFFLLTLFKMKEKLLRYSG